MAAEIGIVKTLTGTATATSTDKSQHNLFVGDSVFADETLSTNFMGSMEIEFSDGNVIALGPNSQALLNTDNTGLQEIVGQDIENEVSALQQALVEGKDPTQIAEATAAGKSSSSNSNNEGTTAVDVGYIAPTAEITSGFETTGISREPLNETNIFEDTLSLKEVIGDKSATGAPTITIIEDTNNDGFLTNSEISGDTDISIGLPDAAVVGDTLNLTIDGTQSQVVLTADMINAGKYITSVTTPAEGVPLNVSTTLTDQAGNTSASASDTVTRTDETATGAPTITITEDANNDGFLTNSEISGNTDISIGLPDAAVVGDTLNLTIDGAQSQVVLTAGMIQDGKYTTSVTTPEEGVPLNVSTTLTDQAGNTSASASDTVTRADASTPNLTISISESDSTVPDSQGLVQTVYDANQNGTLLKSDTLEGLTESSSVSVIGSPKTVSQPYRTGGNGATNIAPDTIEATTGLVYLKAGASISFSGHADDSLLIELGGKILISTTGNMWGAYDTSEVNAKSQGRGTVETTGDFVAGESGYYTLKIFVYNHGGPGDMSVNITVKDPGLTALDTTSFKLFPTIDAVNTANGLHGDFEDLDYNMANSHEKIDTDGGFYPETYKYTLEVDASLTDTDGSETLSDISITGLPSGSDLSSSVQSDGSYQSFEITSDYKLSQADIDSIEASVTATESSNNTTATANETATKSFDVDAADSLIIGGDGSDIIFGGGGGNDTITGGTGSDQFVWNKADISNGGATSADTVTDFNLAEGDVLNLADLLSDNSHTIEGLAVDDVSGGGKHLQLSISENSPVNPQEVQTIDFTNISVVDATSATAMMNSLLDTGNADVV